MKRNARVVKLDHGTTGAVIGTVLSTKNSYAVVRWDNGKLSRHHYDNLISHQAMKSMFKHGPKLRKNDFR